MQSHAVAAERVPAPRFAEALQQRLAVGAQEQCLAGDAALAQRLDQPRHLGEVFRSIARVDTDRRLAVRGFAGADGVGDEARQQAGRDVVDAIKVEVFQHVERDALAGAGQAADHDQSHLTPPLRRTPANRALSPAFRGPPVTATASRSVTVSRRLRVAVLFLVAAAPARRACPPAGRWRRTCRRGRRRHARWRRPGAPWTSAACRSFSTVSVHCTSITRSQCRRTRAIFFST